MCRVQGKITSHLLTGPCHYLSVYSTIKKLPLGDKKDMTCKSKYARIFKHW